MASAAFLPSPFWGLAESAHLLGQFVQLVHLLLLFF